MTGGVTPRSQAGRPRGAKPESSARGGKRRAAETSPADQSTASDSPGSAYRSASSKVAIPRLFPEDPASLEAKAREAAKVDRTNHACEPCRSRKTKCSGERPTCKHCRQFNITCIYADGKRDRARRHQEEMERKITLYEALLVEAGPSIGPTIWSRFQKARAQAEGNEAGTDDSYGMGEDDMEPTRGENVRAASEGSIDAIDSVGEDINRTRDSQASGFVGKASEVDWQRNLNKKENDVEDSKPQPNTPSHTNRADYSATMMSYQTDHVTLSDMNDMEINVYDVPSPQVAHYLATIFFTTVYPSLPFLPKFNFERQLSKAFNGNFDGAAKPNDRWRAIMNLVFAIGTRYLRLTNDALRGPHLDHNVFFARAVRLGLTGRSFLDVTDLQQVQIFALSSFYLNSLSHLNKAWMMSGFAVRGAIALGLQVEIKNVEMSEYSKEARYRLWWAVYAQEIEFQVVTGRPGSISVNDFSTPLPVPYDEELFDLNNPAHSAVNMARFTQASYRSGSVPNDGHIPNITTDAPTNSPNPISSVRAEALSNVNMSGSLFFIFRARLSLVVHELLVTLYSPGVAHHLWSQVQAGIHRFNTLLDDWHSGLPEALDFRRDDQHEWVQHRNELAILFYEAKVLANRPCLCEMQETEPNETIASREFNLQSARLCIESALNILQLLPREIDPPLLAKIMPWWSSIHHIFSAVTILSIALFYDCRHVEDGDQEAIVSEAKHGLKWLHALAQEPNEGAERGWRIASMTLARISQRLGFDMSGVPMLIEARSKLDQQDPRHPSNDPAAYDAPSATRPQSSSFESTAYDPSSFVSLAASANMDAFRHHDANSMFGYLFTAYAPPEGYPLADMGLSQPHLAPLTDAFMPSPTSYAQHIPSVYPQYSSSQMPSHTVTPYYSGTQGGMNLAGADQYPDLPINVGESHGAPLWPISEQMSRPDTSDSRMDVEYTAPQPQRVEQGGRRPRR